MVLSSSPETVSPWRKIVFPHIADEAVSSATSREIYQREVGQKGAAEHTPTNPLGIEHSFQNMGGAPESLWPASSGPDLVYVAYHHAQGEEM